MDPSINLAKLYSSTSNRPNYEPPQAYTQNDTLEENIVVSDQIQPLSEDSKSTYPLPNTSIFMNEDSVELANLDAVLNVTNSIFGLLGSILPPKIYHGQPFYFADLGGIPGGFTQYLQYRLHRSQGYGISMVPEVISSKNPPEGLWDQNGIEFNGVNTFVPLEGTQDHSGDIITNFDSLYERIHKYHPNGLDLIVCNPMTQSTRYFDYLIAQTMFSLSLLAKDGRWVCKIPEGLSSRSLEFMTVISSAFDQFWFFKPFASGFDSSRYLVGKGLINPKNSIKILTNALEIIKERHIDGQKSKEITQLIKSVPKSFQEYIIKANNSIDQLELKYDEKGYNLTRLYYYWDIPSYGEKKIYHRF